MINAAMPELIGVLRDNNKDVRNVGLRALISLAEHSWS